MLNFIGFIIILAGVVLLVKKPRLKRQQKKQRRLAAALVLIGIGALTAQNLPQNQHASPQQEASGQRSSAIQDSSSAPATGESSQQPVSQLAQLNYNNQQEITINNNDPGFTAAESTTKNGAWKRFSDLDGLNRVGTANAMLNKRMMPTEKRLPLHWNPTGWHNKKIHGQYLCNRSHLIGFQLSGENNNPKNLMTGTRELNSPLMQRHEDDIAYYLKQNPNHYVRYEVTPVFRGNELVARGVAMRAQSIGDNTIHFNVYIFNVQPGATINYANGYSQAN